MWFLSGHEALRITEYPLQITFSGGLFSYTWLCYSIFKRRWEELLLRNHLIMNVPIFADSSSTRLSDNGTHSPLFHKPCKASYIERISIRSNLKHCCRRYRQESKDALPEGIVFPLTSPPFFNRIRCKLRGIMCYADIDDTSVVPHVVNSIWDRFPL